MPEPYKTDFNKLFDAKRKQGYKFYLEKEVSVEGKKFTYLECNIDQEILNCAMDLAKEKSIYTMRNNQASQLRTDQTKLIKCAQGILAEMFIHFMLVERYGFDVYRYDLERSTFIYSTEEYDLKIYVSDEYYEIESRSSNIHHISVERFIKNDVIIGPYGNKIKIEDELADFHFRPIYMPEFTPFGNQFKLIITGVATKDDFLRYGYTKSLGQRGTTYKVVDAYKIGDIHTMDIKFKPLKK